MFLNFFTTFLIRKKARLIIIIVGFTLFSIFFILQKLNSRVIHENKIPQTVKIIEQKGKKWKTIFIFEGQFKKKSVEFTLSGKRVKLSYSYKGRFNFGFLNVYLSNINQPTSKNNSEPDILNKTTEKTGEIYLLKPKGTYVLTVNAIGTWKIIVEEESPCSSRIR